MKTMMKRCGVFAVFAAVLAVTAAVILSCPTPESSGGKDDYQPPAGFGAVRLSFNDTTRTTRSIVPGTKLSSFVKFDIQFDAVSGGAVSDSTHTGTGAVAAANVAGPYDLYPGKYDITVIGYTADGEAAEGKAEDVSVIASDTITTPKIWLEAYNAATASGNGKFVYTIDNQVSGNLTTATMTFTKIAGAGVTTPGPINLLVPPGFTGTIDNFPAGYYYVDFVLKKEESPTVMTLRHILHIYKNMTSSFAYTFSDDYFIWAKAELDVDFRDIVDPQPELDLDDGITPVGLDEGETVTVSIDDNGTDPTSIDIVVTNASIYSSITWYYNNATALTSPQGVSASGDTLTVDTSMSPFDRQGTYHLTVVGTTTTGNMPGSTLIYIKVVE